MTNTKGKERQLPPSTVDQLGMALKEARANNRPIVPIVGAGLSADCGFPVVTAIVRYFGKLFKYIEYRVPIWTSHDLKVTFLDKRFNRYKKEPWRFVEDFDWPDRFQLNQDLFTQLNDPDQSTDARRIEREFRKGLDDLLPNLNPQGFRAFNELRQDIDDKLRKGKIPKATLAEIYGRFEENWSKSTAFDVIGDWRRLILYFTNYHSDYADALFARFGATRRPSQGHQFLSFLVKYLAVPTIFTFNFDSLIEQALQSEGARALVFAMEHGAGLPHQGLVHDHLSVIKMHGSTHALLLDEQLDRPLSKDYLQRFDRITGRNPLLLVVGCSEGDRRLRDLVSHVVSESVSKGYPSPSVLWLHYEEKPPRFLSELSHAQHAKTAKRKASAADRIFVCPTNNPGATLLHLYSWLSSCSPAGRIPYLAHIQQPVHLGHNRLKEPPKELSFELISSGFDESPMPTASHRLLEVANHWALNGYHFIWVDLEAVQTFAGVVGSIIDQCRKFDPDLAPSVLPVDIDHINDEGNGSQFLGRTIILAAKRVARALRRTRYYLAFDGLETYAWPATTHHGLTHMAIQRKAAARLKNLVDFLLELKQQMNPEKPKSSESQIGQAEPERSGSRIGVSVDDPKARYTENSAARLSDYIQTRKEAERLTAGGFVTRNLPSSSFNFADTFVELKEHLPLSSLKNIPQEISDITKGNTTPKPSDDLESNARLALVFLNLSCFRRTRPLVAMRHLLDPLLRCESESDTFAVDKLLGRLTAPLEAGHDYPLLRQLEGGGYWFNHTIRDKVYAENTKYTNTHYLGRCLALNEPGEAKRHDRFEHCRNSAFQLFLNAMTHQRIARTWYTRTFVQSQDTFAFLEYTYHQISSVRSLVKLRALTRVASIEEPIAKAVLTGIADCGELVRLIGACDPLLEQLEFENSGPIGELLRHGLAALPKNTSLMKTAEQVEAILQIRHRGDLHSLYRAWTRAEVTLRTQVGAEQLLHWCDELLTDDLFYRCNRVVVHYEPDDWKVGDAGFPHFDLRLFNFGGEEVIDRELEEGVIAKFRRYLQDLQVKLWIERSDYLTCTQERRWHLSGREQNKTKEIEKEQSFVDSCDVLQCHKLLDIVDCRLKSKQESSFDDMELEAGRNEALGLLEKVEGRLRTLEAKLKELEPLATNKDADLPQAQANLNEAWLRLLQLRAECQLGRVSMFSHDGFTGDPANWLPAVVNLGAKQTINQGLTEISTRDARTRYAPRSVVVDPTADGALYLQYRSVFHMLNGRVAWLAKDDRRDEAFQKAFWSFEMARGGLGDNGPLVSALIELYTVEALLARSRHVLYNETASNAFELARSYYESARGGLQRAHESLLVSRRNVIWRKFYFRLATQYHSDRLLLNYARMERRVAERPSRRKKKERRFWEENSRRSLIRVRLAYQSLLSALDLYLPGSDKQERPYPNRYRWLYRMWWELTLCGYATGRLALKVLAPKIEGRADEYMCAQLRWLNKMDGIEESEFGALVLGQTPQPFELLNEEYEKLQSISGEASVRALLRRGELIKQAMGRACRAEMNDRLPRAGS
ncbi:MAG TPA: SIR2 family protein [Pyrinomonadaceae bacterium]|nr:SIR2 family protein [Pyrinomonadaceae bacterium]